MRMPVVESGRKLWQVPRIIDGHLIEDEKDVFAVFEVVSSLNPITADSKEIENTNRRFQMAIDSLKAEEQVQIIVDCVRYDPRADIEKMRQAVSTQAEPNFQTTYPNTLENYLGGYCALNMVPVFRYYVLFTYRPVVNFGASADTSLKSVMNEVTRRSGDFMRMLTSNSIESRQLTEGEITDLVDRTVNPSRLTALPKEVLAGAKGATGAEADGAELMFRSPVINSVPRSDRRYSFIQVGRKLIKTISFLRAPLPDSVLAAVIPDLMMSQREFRFSMFIHGLDQTKATNLIQKKRAAALGAVTFSGGKETQIVEEQAAEYDNLIRAHANKQLRFVRWSAYLSVFGDDEPDLHQAASDLAGSCNVLVPDEGIFRQVEYWQSTLPLGIDRAENVLMAQSNAVAELLPFFEFRSSSPEGGVLLGFSPANQPIFFEPWSKIVSNGNVFVTGQAGGGKSYLINNILNRLGPRALDVSIIDKAKSYRSTCMAAGGDYVEFDLNGTVSVNVWDLLEYDPAFDAEGLNDVDKDGRVLAGKIEEVAGLAEIILADQDQPLPSLEMSVLRDDITLTNNRVLRDPTKKDLPWSERVPTFSDLAETLNRRLDEKDKDPKSDFTPERKVLLQKLGQATTGTLAALVNRRSTLKEGSRFRVFDISNLPEQAVTLSAANYILTTYLMRHWKRNKVKNVRQIAVVDEMAMFMRSKPGRTLLANLARRSRHLGLNPFFATQELNDVLQYDETTAILNNCKTLFLFSQARNVITKITETLSLTDQETRHLENLQMVKGVYSNCFNIYGNHRNIVTVRPDRYTRWLNTTEPTYDVPRVKAALESSGGNIWAAVKKLVETEG